MNLALVITTAALTVLSIILAFLYAYFRDEDNRYWQQLNNAGKLFLALIGGPIIWVILATISVVKFTKKHTKDLDGVDIMKQLFYKEEFKPIKTPKKPKPVVPEVVLIRNIKVELKPRRRWFNRVK